jgi:hypothetical protein
LEQLATGFLMNRLQPQATMNATEGNQLTLVSVSVAEVLGDVTTGHSPVFSKIGKKPDLTGLLNTTQYSVSLESIF